MWTWWDLNPQPSPCKGAALPLELQARTHTGVPYAVPDMSGPASGHVSGDACLHAAGCVCELVLADMLFSQHRQPGLFGGTFAGPVRVPHAPGGYALNGVAVASRIVVPLRVSGGSTPHPVAVVVRRAVLFFQQLLFSPGLLASPRLRADVGDWLWVRTTKATSENPEVALLRPEHVCVCSFIAMPPPGAASP